MARKRRLDKMRELAWTLQHAADLAREVAKDAPTPREPTAIIEAETFLRRLLAKGPVAAPTVLAKAEKAGVSHYALHAAKKRLRVESKKSAAVDGGWVWVLKTTTDLP